MFFKRKRIKRAVEIAPDEIFLDSQNSPKFDRHRMEGRLERPISKLSVNMLGIAFVLVMLVFLGRAADLQVVHGGYYAELSEKNRLRHTPIFSNRGIVLDRNKDEVIWNEPWEENDFSKRRYTDTVGSAHVLGYVGYPQMDSSGNYYQVEFVGKGGVEKVFDGMLSGKNGLRIIETNALGEIESDGVIEPPKEGRTLTLSIDIRVQEKLHNIIRELSENVGFQGGAGVLMDVHTGELIALTSYPEYDPNIMTEGKEVEDITRYNMDPRAPFLNRAVSGLYTPGSIIKPLIALGALGEGVVTPETRILSTRSMTVPNPYFPESPSIFTDWKAHGWVNMRQALAMSSNVYFYQVGGGFQDQRGIGISKIEEYVRMFGFGEKTGIELSNESVGVIPNPAWKAENFDGDPWRLGDTYFTAIGQYGFQITPLQAARAMAGIASGRLPTPTVRAADGRSTSVSTHIDIPEEHFRVVREGMRLAVTNGTASGLSLPTVAVAAKTGTAELGVQKALVNSWSVGFFPYDDPQYAFAVVMERGPKENLIGGTFVMRQLLDWMVREVPEYIESVEK